MTPSLFMMRMTWLSAVRWEITSFAAMCLLEQALGDQVGDLMFPAGQRSRQLLCRFGLVGRYPLLKDVRDDSPWLHAL